MNTDTFTYKCVACDPGPIAGCWNDEKNLSKDFQIWSAYLPILPPSSPMTYLIPNKYMV
jgi:hypothetical protein